MDVNHALHLANRVDAATQSGIAESDSSKRPSFTAAVTRAIFGTLAFLFKRPIRLFRPVKISTMTGIQAIAEEQGKTVTPAFVRGLIRKEGWAFLPRHVLPPLMANATIGLTLFTSYSTMESLMAKVFADSPASEYVLVPFVSGSFAGACQSIISAPLDNARLLLLRRQRLISLHGHRKVARLGGTAFTGWYHLLRDAVFQSGPQVTKPVVDRASASTLTADRVAQAKQWARRGWSLFSLTLAKDAASFGVFFVVFEVGREAARRVGLTIDGLPITELDRSKRSFETTDEAEYSADFEGGTRTRRRSVLSLVVQSVLILVSGGVAGFCFAIVARPFERARAVIWEGRSRWAERDGRLRVVEELSLRGGDVSSNQLGRTPRDKRVRIGSAQRHAVRVQTARRRGVGRTFVRATRRKLKNRLFAKHRAYVRRAAAASVLTSGGAPPRPARQPMPSALSLVRDAAQRYGTVTFFFAPSNIVHQMNRRRATGPAAALASSSTSNSASNRPRRIGPTRLSARGKQLNAVAPASGGRAWRVARILAYIPPYAVGLGAYAWMSGDLK